MTAVGFEPTQLALVELESTPLDHSGKLSLVWFCLFEPFSFEWLTSEAGSAMNVRLGDPRKTSAKFILISGFPPPPPQKKKQNEIRNSNNHDFSTPGMKIHASPHACVFVLEGSFTLSLSTRAYVFECLRSFPGFLVKACLAGQRKSGIVHPQTASRL